MSLYLLDTDILSLFQTGHTPVIQRVGTAQAGQLAVSVISVEEQLGGWYAKLRQTKKRPDLARIYQKLSLAVRLLSQFEILSFSEAAMDRYDDLRKDHRSVGKNDLRIAAIALHANAILVTRNTRDFGQIPGLPIEDWSK